MFKIERKWIISMLGMYSCGLMYAIRTGMGIAMVRMVNSTESKTDNETIKFNKENNIPTYDWNETIQGLILGGIFYLYWIVPTIVGNFMKYFNVKWLTLIGVLIPCILIALVPIMAEFNVYLLITIMIIIGVAQSFLYPSLFHLYVQWFNNDELSRANSSIQVGQSIGGTIIYFIGGYLCETKFGWPLIYYLQSILHIPWILLWLYFGGENQQYKSQNKEKEIKQRKTPWLAILKSGAVWSSTLSKFSCSWGFYLFISKMPSYLNQQHNVSIVVNGIICGLAFMSYGIMCFIAPYISNYLIQRKNLDKLFIRKSFQAIAMLIPAISLLLITFISNQIIIILLIIVSMLSYGFFTGGEWTMVSEYSPNFVGIISGLVHILGLLCGFLAPYIVGIILDSNSEIFHNDNEFKWNCIFWLTSFLYLIGYIAFYFLSTVEQQYWDKI